MVSAAGLRSFRRFAVAHPLCCMQTVLLLDDPVTSFAGGHAVGGWHWSKLYGQKSSKMGVHPRCTLLLFSYCISCCSLPPPPPLSRVVRCCAICTPVRFWGAHCLTLFVVLASLLFVVVCCCSGWGGVLGTTQVFFERRRLKMGTVIISIYLATLLAGERPPPLAERRQKAERLL